MCISSPGQLCIFGPPLGLVHRVIISARNGDVIFVSPKLRYHESNQRFFFLIHKETIWQLFNVKITVLEQLLSTLNPSSVPLYIFFYFFIYLGHKFYFYACFLSLR